MRSRQSGPASISLSRRGVLPPESAIEKLPWSSTGALRLRRDPARDRVRDLLRRLADDALAGETVERIVAATSGDVPGASVARHERVRLLGAPGARRVVGAVDPVRADARASRRGSPCRIATPPRPRPRGRRASGRRACSRAGGARTRRATARGTRCRTGSPCSPTRCAAPGPGSWRRSASVMPSSGWMRRTSRLGSMPSAGTAPAASGTLPANGEWGTRRNWMTISVARFGSRLPVRR